MTQEDHERVENLFHQVLQLPVEQRAAFIRNACGSDDAIRREVESLLAAHAEASGFMATPAIEVLAAALARPGETIGPYRLGALLGRGGMGEVYEAHDTRLGRDVAIKILPDVFRADRERLARFEREARAAAALNHPHICTIYDVGPDYLVMERLEGDTLADLLTRGPLPVSQAIEYGAEIADALAAAHARGIVHRDLKPANVMVTPAGTKVLDFGLAKQIADIDADASVVTFTAGEAPAAPGGTTTRPGQILGTTAYMSPEQAEGKPVDPRSDVFSFGVLLYEMLGGRRPFSGDTALSTLAAILKSAPDPLRSLRPGIPEHVERVVMRCLEKSPAARYASATDVSRELAGYRAAGVRSRGMRIAASPWQRRPIQIALGAMLIIGATLGTWLWSRGSGKPVTGQEHYEQITYFAASATSPSLSRDGRMMTFIQGTEWFEGRGQVYVKALPNGEPVQLTHDRLSKMSPSFSPDGSRIVYTVAAPPDVWDAWTVPVIGGEPRLWLKNTATPSWLPDKRIMFSEITSGLHMRVVTSTENREDIRPVYTPSHQKGMAHWSHLSPDGTHVLVVEMDEAVWRPCRVVALDGSSMGQRAGPDAQCISAAWSLDGRWVYTSSLTSGAFHIWRQRFPDGIPEQITSGPTEEEGIAMAPDGVSLLASLGASQQAVWLRDDGVERTVSTEGYAFIPSLPNAFVDPFSADGNTLYYLARRGGVRSVGPRERAGELWKTNLVTARSEVVVPGSDIVGYDVSREMDKVTFAAIDKDGQSHIWLARLDHQLQPRAIVTAASDSPRFGTSEEIFSRVTEGHTGLSFIYRTRLDGSAPQKVVATPILFFLSASPDGAWVVAQLPGIVGQAGDTVAFPTAGGMPVTVCASCSADWTADGKAFVVKMSGDDFSMARTITLALEPGRKLPRLPAEGIRSLADLAGLSVLSSVERSLFPGPKQGQYAFGRIATQRNIYRIPLS